MTLLIKGVAKYDTLVDKDEACTQAWADYESNLHRRAGMIPQLVAVVKGSAAHEEATLVAVTQARANATCPEIKLNLVGVGNVRKMIVVDVILKVVPPVVLALLIGVEALAEVVASVEATSVVVEALATGKMHLSVG